MQNILGDCHRWCRCDQPPANRCDPFGVDTNVIRQNIAHMDPDFFPAVAVACILTLWLRRYVRRPGVTDQPWFWVALFSGTALLGMLLIVPKYNQRQAKVELRYIARQRAVPSTLPEVNGAGGPPTAEEIRRQGEPTSAPSPDEMVTSLIVPPYYLAIFIGMIFIAAAICLHRKLTSEANNAAAKNAAAKNTNGTTAT